ncbi:putative helicase [Symbiobacterium thermophilum IAM 14863]|nr:putative helicase [Symbiobacterium thermophilum IAM 14863]
MSFTPPQDWNDYLHPEIWAKTARGVELAEGEGHYHPLCCHMIDTAMVAWRMWRYVLPQRLRDQIRRQLGLQTDDEAGRWIAFFAGLHDLGKATPAFAKQWPEGWRLLTEQKYGAASGSESKPHYVLTTFLLESLLEELGLPGAVAVPVAAVIGAHHGLFPTATDLRHAERYAGKAKWQEAQAHLVRLLAHVLGVDRLNVPTGDLWQANSLLVILAGLTSVADWIASNHTYFPFAGDRVRLPSYARQARWRAWMALHQLGWFHRPVAMAPRSFTELFDKVPNHLQKQVLAIADRLSGPSLVLLEYPMGGGKTEAALYLADSLAVAAGQKGLYFALPTMATSNQMFGRVNRYLVNRFPGSRINVQLLHGHASLNAEFELLRAAHLQELERRRAGREQELAAVGESTAATVLAAEWFTYKKRGLLAPYGIGTIDQALLSVLQTKHFFVRLFGLAGKVVILDEVHAYDTYMQTLLTRLLTWLAACGTSVVLLSATLPAHTRKALVAAYAAGRGLPAPAEPEVTYPRVTWLTDMESNAVHIEGAATRTITLRRYAQDDEGWMRALQEALVDGGCAAVIVNTVSRAQAVYQKLQDYFPPEELCLFHARYPFDDRMAREREVLTRFGPGIADRPRRAVLVATQVVEQSLDLDFDLLVTDLAPVDLVFQRSGRLWRHRREWRPPGFTEPTLWLLMPPLDEQGVPQFERGSRLIYDHHTMLRSWLVLAQQDHLCIPDQLEPMVEAVYRPADPPEELPEPLRALWLQTRAVLEAEQARDQQEARRRYIPDVHQNLLEMVLTDLEEEGESHPAVQALTRLGGIAVTAVCLVEADGRLWAPGPEPREIHLQRRPDKEDVRALLGRAIAISFDPGLARQILALDPPEVWEGSAYLRRCRLLTFDPAGNCLTAGLPLRLDPELGLLKIPGGEEEEEECRDFPSGKTRGSR